MSWLSKIDASHDLIWTGTGSGGGFTYRIARSGSAYTAIQTLAYDADPMGPRPPRLMSQPYQPVGDPGVVPVGRAVQYRN